MGNRLAKAILVVFLLATVAGVGVAIYTDQTNPEVAGVSSEQIGGYPAPGQGYPVGYPAYPTWTPMSHGIVIDPPAKNPTRMPTPKDYTPAPKVTPTIEPTPIKDPDV